MRVARSSAARRPSAPAHSAFGHRAHRFVPVLRGSRFRLELSGNVYYLGGTGTSARNGYELVTRARVALAFRVHGRDGLTLQYVASSRDARYDDPDLDDTLQEVGAISLYYSLFTDTALGRSN